MKMYKRVTNKWTCRLLAAVLVSVSILAFWPATAHAAAGRVYSCTVNRMYQHPVTGVIEDSGGEESYSIGQGMVEGCVYPNGILEVTDDGRYYLTIRMSLMDYTSGHTFWVQTWGEDGWATPAAGITGTGTDSNGTTADICIQVPSEQCVVRGAMYVEPMGRDVYWYMYPNNFAEGNNTDMNATMVTAPSGSDQAAQSGENTDQGQQSGSDQGQNTQGSDQNQQSGGSESSGSSQTPRPSSGSLSGGGSLSSGSSGLSGSSSGSSAGSTAVKPSTLQSSANPASDGSGTDGENTDAAADGTEENTLTGLNSTISEPSAVSSSENGTPDTESSITKAQGLSLSTAGAAAEGDPASAGAVSAAGSAAGITNPILTNTLSVIIPGGILITVAAILVYFFRKNWKRWGGAPDDE